MMKFGKRGLNLAANAAVTAAAKVGWVTHWVAEARCVVTDEALLGHRHLFIFLFGDQSKLMH